MQTFQEGRATRYEARTVANYSKVQKLTPIMAMLAEGSEGGMMSEDITVELDPIPGRLLTPITAEVFCVFVPMQAIDALINPEADYAGMTEVVREKLLSGAIFGVENEGEITQRCGINPRSVGGEKKVNRMVRIGHNCAVNFLRRRVHKDAVQLSDASTAVTPALLSSTILTRLNGVLDPDDRINGSFDLNLGTASATVTAAQLLPVGNIYMDQGVSSTLDHVTDGTSHGVYYASTLKVKRADASSPVTPGVPNVTLPALAADLSGLDIGAISLTDLYNAETMDRLTRTMGKIMESSPEYGEEMVLRWAHGLQIDTGKMPVLLSQQRKFFGMNVVGAMDTSGVQNETIRSDMAVRFNFSVPIPRTELGGMIYTFLSVKPDETLASQPHPVLTQPFGLRNFAADQLALDPVPVAMRHLDSDIATGSEGTISMYTGLNELLRSYVHYGFGRNVDQSELANKMAIWQLEIPLSVTPATVLHPNTPDQSIFADTNGRPVRYTCAHRAVVRTPITFGPTPVETLPIINSADIFEVE